MNNYIVTKSDKRRAFLSLYFIVLGLIGLSIVVALAFVHIRAFHNLYYTAESTPEKPQGTLTALILMQIPILVAWFYLRLNRLLGNNGKMNICIIISLTIGANLSLYFYHFSWQETALFLGIAFIMFNLAVFLALFIKKDFSHQKKFFLIFTLVLLLIIVALKLLKISFLDTTIFYTASLVGGILVFLDVQDWWFKLDNVPDQENFDKMFCHTMINLVAGFWLIYISPTIGRFLIKLFVSPYVLQKD